MKKTTTPKTRKRTMAKVILFIIILTLIFSAGITSTLAVPQTSIHVHGIPTGTTTVDIEYLSAWLPMAQQGGSQLWSVHDNAAFVWDDVGRIRIDSVEYPKSVLRLGTEAGGTLNIWLELPEMYSVVTSVVNGTIDPSEHNIPAGENRTINYAPLAGYHLLSITVDGTPLTAGQLVTFESSYAFNNIQANHTIDVVYEADPTYMITTSVVNGTIDPNVTGINAGENRTINYSPTAGFVLASITVDGTPLSAGELVTYGSSYDFNNIQANHAIVVVYEAEIITEDEFTILTSVVNGTIDPDVVAIPDTGTEDRTINYAPLAGFHLVSVTVDGNPESIVTYPTSYEFVDIDSDHTIHVVYAADVVTDTISNMLLIIGGALLLAGLTAIFVARRRKKVTE